jgi:hypothetical protein
MGFFKTILVLTVYMITICISNLSYAQHSCTSLFGKETTYNYRIELLQEKASKVTSFFKYGKSFYGGAGVKAFEKLNAISYHFAQLIVDPGIVLNLEKFIQFVKQNKLQDSNPWEAREAFSKHLGTKKMYRALALTEAQAIQISKSGMHSALIRNDQENIHAFALETDANGNLVKDANGEFIRDNSSEFDSLHYHILNMVNSGGSYNARTLSLSEHPEIAIAVAYQETKTKEKTDVYLFEVEIPKIDIFQPSMKLGLDANYLDLKLLSMLNYIEAGSSDGKSRKKISRDSAERFVLYSISPRELKSIQKVPESKIGYVVFRSSITGTRGYCLGRCSSFSINQN